jgi:YhcH/YjgK/YiaL family protein
MVYDKIDNIEIYKGLSPDIYEALKFLQNATPSTPTGVIQLNPRVKAIVSEYETKAVNENGYEAHKRYIDIQALLEGEEMIACQPIEWLQETKPYSEECDAAFYAADEVLPQPSFLRLRPSFFAILYPQDGHMPQLSIITPTKVKKVVIKVAVP